MSQSEPSTKITSISLFLIILIEGFVSVACEILVIRQLLPQVGSSVIITSLIIGVFLLFLAVGYWRGGLYTENFYAILKRNFILGTLLLGIGLSYLFITFFFSLFTTIFGLKPIIILSLYLILIIAPLVYLFGQTIPITMNLVKEEVLVGAIGGKVLFLSTIGSFFGSILTTLLLMENLGVAWTVVINSLFLLYLCFLLPEKIKQKINTTLFSIIIVLLLYLVNIYFEKSYFLATTSYANYHLINNAKIENSSGRILEINESPSSFLDSQNKGFGYIELIKKILFADLKLQNANILVLGAGGFTLSAAGTFNNNFTYVDIDPQIYNIVQRNFLSQINGYFINEDARVFVKNKRGNYDVIVSDAYSNIHTIPSNLLTIEYFSDIKNALKVNGIAIFNIIANPYMEDKYSKRINNTIMAVFGSCMVIPLEYSDRKTNIIYICRKAQNELDDTIYSDNKNPSTINAAGI